jgi:hypothetical protein
MDTVVLLKTKNATEPSSLTALARDSSLVSIPVPSYENREYEEPNSWIAVWHLMGEFYGSN